MAEPNREPLTLRLRPDDKAAFVAAAEHAGLEAGIAARTIMEMVIRRMRDGQSFFETVRNLERALNILVEESDRERIMQRIAEIERRQRSAESA